MPLSKETQNEIISYCTNHLASDIWYEKQFDFVKDEGMRKRIISEFKGIRFAYKLYEGIGAEGENLRFEIRSQLISYATLYEAILTYVLDTYYSDTEVYFNLTHYEKDSEISIPKKQEEKLSKELVHNGEKLIICVKHEKTKEAAKIRFDDKCNAANKLGLIKSFLAPNGEKIDFVSELKEFYSYRNAIHLQAEARKESNNDFKYELDLSKKAYRRMKPFLSQIRDQLISDEKIQ